MPDIPGEESTAIEVDERVMPLAALRQAAHEFSNQAKIDLQPLPDLRWRVTFSSIRSGSPRMAQLFRDRVIDIAVQHEINERTRVVRDALVRAALWESLPK